MLGGVFRRKRLVKTTYRSREVRNYFWMTIMCLTSRFSRGCNFHFRIWASWIKCELRKIVWWMQFYRNSRKMNAPSAHSLNRGRYNMHHRVKMSWELRAIHLNANLVILHYARSCKLNVKRKGSALSWQRSRLRQPDVPFVGTSEQSTGFFSHELIQLPFFIISSYTNHSINLSYNYNLIRGSKSLILHRKSKYIIERLYTHMCACMRVCVRARARARARVCVCVCVWFNFSYKNNCIQKWIYIFKRVI